MGDEQLVEQLVAARKPLSGLIAGVTEEALRCAPAAGEWSALEVLAHVIDVDRHWLAQALAIRDEPEHVFVHFDDGRWKSEHPNAQSLVVSDVLSELDGSFREVIGALASLTEEELNRAGKHPRGTPYTVRDVFLRFPAHDRNHTKQIRAILAAATKRRGREGPQTQGLRLGVNLLDFGE